MKYRKPKRKQKRRN